jgi:uncharacterized protein YqhQ
MTMGTYIYSDILGSIAYMSLGTIVSMPVNILVLVIAPLLTKKFGLERLIRTGLLVGVLVHLALLIPVVGVTYEFTRFVGRHDNALTRVLSAPGMWLQNFTTNEPDDSMIEVAIEALQLVLPTEQGKDAW